MREGEIVGHEGVGIVEAVGDDVRNLTVGDRVVIPSTVGCGYCSYCRAGYYAQCDNANPGGKRAGTMFFRWPRSGRRLGRDAGRKGAGALCQHRAGQAAG